LFDLLVIFSGAQAVFHTNDWLLSHKTLGKYMNQGAELKHRIGRKMFYQIGGGGIQGRCAGTTKKKARKAMKIKGRRAVVINEAGEEPVAGEQRRLKQRKLVYEREPGTKHKLGAEDQKRVLQVTQRPAGEAEEVQAAGAKARAKFVKKPMQLFLRKGHKVGLLATQSENSAEAGDNVGSIPAGAAANPGDAPAAPVVLASQAILKAAYPGKSDEWHRNWTEYQVVRGLITVNYINSVPFCSVHDSFECACPPDSRCNNWQSLQQDSDKDDDSIQDDDCNKSDDFDLDEYSDVSSDEYSDVSGSSSDSPSTVSSDEGSDS